jgi:Tfp pilus assembly protein PilW
MINEKQNSTAGFTLLELVIAMGLSLVAIGIATTILAEGLKIRTRENTRSDVLADLQRGLNIMSREVANAGYGGMPDNGVVLTDSSTTSIRILANLNAFSAGSTVDTDAGDPDEDVKFYLSGTNLLRHGVNENDTTVLASGISGLDIFYANTSGTASIDSVSNTCQVSSTATELASTQYNQAKYVVIAICGTLPQVGTPGSPGYKPSEPVKLLTTVALRNSNLDAY